MKNRKLPTAAELEILQVLWQKGPTSVRAVLDHLAEEREIGYTTVLKQMQIMADKGLLTKDASVRPQVYRPAEPKRRTRGGLVRRLVDSAFDGSAGDLALHALQAREIPAVEREQIRAVLDSMEEGR